MVEVFLEDLLRRQATGRHTHGKSELKVDGDVGPGLSWQRRGLSSGAEAVDTGVSRLQVSEVNKTSMAPESIKWFNNTNGSTLEILAVDTWFLRPWKG